MGANPAGEAIDGALPPMPKVKEHFRSLPYQEVRAALETVEATQASIPGQAVLPVPGSHRSALR